LSGGREPLDAWLRDQEGRPPDDDLAPLLPAACERLLAIDPAAVATRRAQALTLAAARVNLARIGRLAGVLDRFASAGIRCVVLKGAALALRYYGSLGARAMGDIDIMVRPADVPRAAALLAELGWTTPGGSSDRVLRDTMRVQHARPYSSGPAHSLDLHWRSLQASTPEVDDRFWEAAVICDAAAGRATVLGPSDEVFHVCCHAVQPAWTPSPRWILDVHAILEAEGGRVDWDRVVETARMTATTVRLREAVDALDAVMPGRVPSLVKQRLSATRVARWERRELRLFERMPPFGGLDRLRWHWYAFRRLRPGDGTWRTAPLVAGFSDYLRVKRRLRADQAARSRVER
jgi:hypothetical protein